MLALLIVGCGLLGLAIGSFLNVVIYRVPRDESIVTPRSRCPSCAAPIKEYDNIPVLSWVLLRGKCRHCHAPISPRYIVVEIATGGSLRGVWQLEWATSGSCRHFSSSWPRSWPFRALTSNF